MDKFQLASANVSDSWFDFKNQVRAFFSPSDYTREMFSTVSRLWVFWHSFVISLFVISSLISLSNSEWLLALLQFLIAALFGLVAFYELAMNMYQRTIENLFEVARDQQKTMHQMMDVIDPTYQAGEFD